MVKFGFEAFKQRRKIAIIVGSVICVAVPTPFVLSWLDSFGESPIKNYTGIPISWRTYSAIKIRYHKVTRIPIRYKIATRIPIEYHTLSVIKVTYRNGGDSSDGFDDPRFHIVRLRSRTFRVAPEFNLIQ